MKTTNQIMSRLIRTARDVGNQGDFVGAEVILDWSGRRYGF